MPETVFDCRGEALRSGDLCRYHSGGETFRMLLYEPDGFERETDDGPYCGYVVVETTDQGRLEELNVYHGGSGPYCPGLIRLEGA
jgi:hypothetical protein